MAWPIAARAQQSATPDIKTPDADLPGVSAIQAGAGMKSSISALAAHNNAMWCDAVFRAHDRPGEFHEALWLTRLGTPRFYPDAVTTAGVEAAPAQLEAIADLIGSNRRRQWFVKDSFRCLRLESLGFEPFFDAEWIAMSGAQPDFRHHQPGDRPAIVTDEAGLSAWERSWAGEDAKVAAIPCRACSCRACFRRTASFLSPFRERMAVPAAASSIEALMSSAFQICSALKWIGSGEA
jgi:hypothetical protein